MKSSLLRILYAIKKRYYSTKLKIGLKLGLIKSVMIMPYKGFGNQHEIYFLGRVIRDRGIGISQIEDSRWRNFVKMYKRFSTWEIPRVRVKATFAGIEQIVLTDDEGYFEVRLVSESPFKIDNSWQTVALELIDKVIPKQGEVKTYNKIFIPSGLVEFGVISDIDDTIVPTGATRLWEMLKTTFLGNAHTRLPFSGVSAFYQALAKGSDGVDSNPFFFVSSSPWNLYDFLMEFLDVHGIPKGPLMLRDIGLSRTQFIAGSHDEHKLLQVENIFALETNLQFILIGDSGQKDPEIYLQAIKDFPNRVKMVYIRDVQESRQKAMAEIASEMQTLGIKMLMVKDTVEAALDALERGWILESDIQEILEARDEDEKD